MRRAIVGGIVTAALVLAAPAEAQFGLRSFTATTSSDAAGAHADVTTTFRVDADASGTVRGHLRTTRVALPPGLVGNPQVVPRCDRAAFDSAPLFTFPCPAGSQVGEATFYLGNANLPLPIPAPVYNLTPTADSPAVFGVWIFFGLVRAVGTTSLRPDGGLTLTIPDAPNLPGLEVVGADFTFFGVPADHGVPGPRVAFMTNPTSCDGPLTTTIEANSYEDAAFDALTATLPARTGCDQVPFGAEMGVAADNPVVDSPSSLRVDLAFAQSTDPDARGSAALRRAIVGLPEGMSLNPSLAGTLIPCSDAAFDAGSTGPAQCPGESVVGSVGLDVPVLAEPLGGSVFIAEPRPGQPFRLFVEAAGQGVRIKLVGEVDVDPSTGKVTTTFAGAPPVPVRRFSLTFRGGDRAAIAMPPTCGTRTVDAFLTSTAGSTVTPSGAIHVAFDPQGSACPDPLPFAPRFAASTSNTAAGADTHLSMTFARDDRQQPLGATRLSLPPGLLGRLAAFPICPDAAAAEGTCDGSTQIGAATATAGAGAPALITGGQVFLTGPYRPGDIAGLSIVVPARVGPFDLGRTVVRAGLRVRSDVGLDIVSDPLPTIIGGLPLRLRSVTLDIVRDGFMFNPTSCAPKEIAGVLTSAGGTEARVSAPLTVTGCDALPFAPGTRVTTSKPRRRDGATGVTVTLTQAAGEANVRTVEITLPKALGARTAGPITAPCRNDQWDADACPAASIAGSASATSPLLPIPLQGPVAMVSVPGSALPKLGVRLKGPISLDLLGDVALTRGGRIRTTFQVPDVPISRFQLALGRGDRAVVTGEKLCRARNPRAQRRITAQSGKVVSGDVKVDRQGCRKRRG
ncbi:MAG TPA: hypothetical protein VFR97_08110 [Capillimicrobium sp.]|nr:hypothetical protein [Capillimicrobium sp.]